VRYYNDDDNYDHDSSIIHTALAASNLFLSATASIIYKYYIIIVILVATQMSSTYPLLTILIITTVVVYKFWEHSLVNFSAEKCIWKRTFFFFINFLCTIARFYTYDFVVEKTVIQRVFLLDGKKKLSSTAAR